MPCAVSGIALQAVILSMDSGSRYSKLKKRHRLLALLRILRIQNLLIIACCQVLAGIQLFEFPFWNQPPGISGMVLLVLASIFSAAAGYLINDYYDVKIDVVNRPRRVVVGKVISRRQTMMLHLIFIFLALFSAFLLGKKVFFVVAFCSAWLWLYSNLLKRLPLIGNVSVSLLTSCAVYLPGLVFSGAKDALFLFSVFSFWISLIREVVKDMEDMKGDARHGCRTLPIVLGIRKTKYFLYAAGLLFAISFCVSFFFLPGIWIPAALALAFPLAGLFYRIYKADTVRAFAGISLFCKWFMIAGMAGMLLL